MAEACPPILKPSDLGLTIATSDVTLFDGNFTCNTVPPNSSLNDVLEILDAAICAIVVPATINATNVTYTGDLVYSCFTLTGADAETIIEELATEICSVSSSLTTLTTTVADLCTTDIDLCGFNVDLYACAFGDVAPPEIQPPNDNLTNLLSLIMSRLCRINFMLDLGKSADGQTGSNSLFQGYASDLKSVVTGIVGDSRDYTTEGGTLTTSPASLVPFFGASSYIVNGWGVDMPNNSNVTLSATSDNYVDIRQDGTYTVSSVAIAAPEPPVAATSYRLYKVVTDATGVVSSTNVQTSYALDGTTFTDDSIVTRHITDLSVTGVKLETITAAATEGDANFYQVTYDTKGRITSSINKVVLAGLLDGDVLTYDIGSGNWVNSTVAGTLLPVGTNADTLRYNGAAWVSSSVLKNTGTNVGVAISVGLPTKSLTIGASAEMANNLSVVSSLLAIAAGGGSLAANTYYYVVTAVDIDGGETVVSAEASAGVDGVTTTSISLSWDAVPLTASYKIYRGTVSGTYTSAQSVTTNSFSDTSAGWVGASTPINTDTESYGWLANANGIRIGNASLTTAVLAINSGHTKDFSLFSEAGAIGSKETIVISDDPAAALLAFPASNYGMTIDKSWDGVSGLRVVNDGSGTSTGAAIGIGSIDGVSGVNGETVEIAYWASTYVRSGAPATGVNFYQNKAVLKSNNDISGMIISVGGVSADLQFEMNNASKMILESGGSLGLGLSDAGATSVNASALFEMKSTTKGFLPPRMTSAQMNAIATPVEGLIVHTTDADRPFFNDGTSWKGFGDLYGLYSQTVQSATVTNTTAETTIIGAGVGSLVIPANGFKVGDSFHGKIGGVISTLNNHEITIKIKTGATVLASTGLIALEAVTALGWEIELDFTVATLGATGSICTNGNFAYNRNTGSLEGFVFQDVQSIDTTISNTLNITVEWNQSNASDEIYSANFVLYRTYAA